MNLSDYAVVFDPGRDGGTGIVILRRPITIRFVTERGRQAAGRRPAQMLGPDGRTLQYAPTRESFMQEFFAYQTFRQSVGPAVGHRAGLARADFA